MFSLDAKNQVCCVWYGIQYRKHVLGMLSFLKVFQA